MQEPRKQAMGASPATDHRPDVRSRGAWAVACALAVLMRSGLSFLIYRRGRVIERPLSGSLGRPARRDTPSAGDEPFSADGHPGDLGPAAAGRRLVAARQTRQGAVDAGGPAAGLNTPAFFLFRPPPCVILHAQTT